MGCGHGREFKSGPAKPVAMVDSRSGLAGPGANPREGLIHSGSEATGRTGGGIGSGDAPGRRTSEEERFDNRKARGV